MNFKRFLALTLSVLVAVVFLPEFTVSNVSAASASATVYVSSTGSDSNDGSEAAPYLTFSKAFKSAKATELTVVLLDDISIAQGFVFNNGNDVTTHTIITAASPDVVFNLTAKAAIGFYDNVTFEAITLDFVNEAIVCAGGKNLTVADTVTFTNRVKIFGGGYTTAVESTNMTLNGGIYRSIYAGGYAGSVTGNAVLNVGGNVNAGDGINDDDSATLSPCRIYGGCYSGTVGGTTTVNFGGNAVSQYLIGSGNTATDTVAGDITLNITGGKIMNVYGGSAAAAVNTDTYIYMTGGLAEAVFGGCYGVGMTGNAFIYLGGTADVSRRVYGGCYNDWSLGWKSNNYVTGSTTVVIDNGCKIGSKTGLSSGNSLNMGLFAGSRCQSNQSAEVSTLIFLNNSYSTYSSKIGDISGWGSTFKSHTDYTVKATAGGSVKNSAIPGTVTLLPDSGKMAAIGSNYYASGETHTLSAATTDVSFVDVKTATFEVADATGEAPSNISAPQGGTITLPDCASERDGYEFVGWSTTESATEAEYVAGDTYTLDGDTTFYSVWLGEIRQYKVYHYYELHTKPEKKLYKIEYFEARVGEQTEAKALNMLGYTASEIIQKEITPSGTAIVSVIYSMTNYRSNDVNYDGTTDMLDIAVLQRCLAGWEGYDHSKVCIYAADCNVDGSVNAGDALTLLEILAGNSPTIGTPDTEDNWGDWV